jgi:hypothetical protein
MRRSPRTGSAGSSEGSKHPGASSRCCLLLSGLQRVLLRGDGAPEKNEWRAAGRPIHPRGRYRRGRAPTVLSGARRTDAWPDATAAVAVNAAASEDQGQSELAGVGLLLLRRAGQVGTRGSR